MVATKEQLIEREIDAEIVGCQRLLIALVKEAIHSLSFRALPAFYPMPELGAWRVKMANEAYEWFASSDISPFSWLWAADCLGLDGGHMQRLIEVKSWEDITMEDLRPCWVE